MTQNPQDELLDRARKVIRELREKLAAAEVRSQPEPIAIVGMGLRFPGCGSDPEEFWRMIAEGRDAVTIVPQDRWDSDALYAPEAAVPGKINTRHAAFLDEVRRFDAAFFDITPREATRMDPQQRIFLEVTWHALEDAGLPRARIAGSDAGVFVGVHNHSSDYQAMQFGDPMTLDAYAATGTAHDMIAGRLAYWLDLHGPAIAVNTACSSSLTAVHLACSGLRAGDCNVALAGGVNLLLAPGFSVAAAQLQLLSADGRCKTFDARADGMGRGEGCGVVVLKKLSDARRDGDRVLAIIRGSAVNQDGKTNGLTAPNGLAQQRVLRRALEDAGVEPSEIGYVEAHGTGTALGDPIEVEALAEVVGGTQRTAPCTLGAVKANVGHLEGAAGIAGLIKTVLVLQRRWLPPVANLEKLNPHLAVNNTGLNIPQHGREWKTSGRRLAGVSSFGWSGTNAHVVLEEAPPSNPTAEMPGEWPVVLSAQSAEALRALAIAYADRLEAAGEAELADISYTSTVRRTHHPCRMAMKGTKAKEIASQLRRRVANVDRVLEIAESKNISRAVKSGSEQLEKLMSAWEAGAEVDWATIFPAQGNVVDLPRYPFQGRPYWLGASMAPSSPSRENSLAHDWFYSTQWIEKQLDRQPRDSDTPTRIWLIFHSEDELGSKLADAIRERGDRVVELSHPKSFAEDLKSLSAQLTADGVRPHYAIYLPGKQEPAETIADALDVTQAIIRNRIPVKLWFVTQEAASHPSHAAIRGFSRVSGLEHPEVASGVIDIDCISREYASAVCEEIAQAIGEDRVALRQGRRWVARIRRDSLTTQSERLKLKADRSYLVTGAFGRLGIQIASWLIDRGARHLVLIGRRAPSEMANPDLIDQLESWHAQGITVLAEACNVSDQSEVDRLLARIGQSGKALAGVVHAAAALRFRPLAEATREDVELAFRAKFDGARLLDHGTRQSPLDFFVLFSSAAAAIGLRNGALYAAANSCLETIVVERQALGLPVLCVEWGAWEYHGEDRQQELVAQSGFLTMPPGGAFRALEALLGSGSATGLIADIDWTILGPALEMRGRLALAAEIVGALVSPPKAADDLAEAGWLDALRDLPPFERNHRVLDFVSGVTRKVFGMLPEDRIDESRGLFQLGMDSLMSVRLKRRLEAGTGLRLPGTVTLTYPSIAALADYLEAKLFPSAVVQAVSAAVPSHEEKAENFSASVAEMNDLETDAAIAAELAAIQQKLGVL
jgi:acyl transferase domain-containing protein/acyl carrier protein